VTGFFQSIITVVLFILILGALVVIHELGHFFTARAFKVRVLEFGIGFPPRAKVWRTAPPSQEDVERAAQAREKAIAAARQDPALLDAILDAEPEVPTGTVYTLNWLPIGGFVKLEGEDGNDADDPRSFSHQGVAKKLTILVAGVLMNVLLAFVIFTGIAWLASPFVGVKFFEVQPDSPAAAAGLQPGEAIVAIDGERYQFITGPNALPVLRERAGETLVLTIADTTGARRDVTVTLRPESEIIEGVQGALGIMSNKDQPFEAYFYGEYTTNDLATAIQIGIDQTVRWMGLIVGGLASLVSSVVSNPTAPPPVSGPVGIATQIGDIFWNSGPILTLYVAGILSANLAVVNILPFPPLDGGRMLMITLKRIFGARISLRAEQLTYVVGFVFLFAFIIWVTGFDIIRIVGG
jgi:regulator of sigma E protease